MRKKTNFDIQSCCIGRLPFTLRSHPVEGRVNVVVCQALYLQIRIAVGFSEDTKFLDVQICLFEGLIDTYIGYWFSNLVAGHVRTG